MRRIKLKTLKRSPTYKSYFFPIVYFHNLFDRLIEINLKIDSIDIFSKLLSQIAKLTKIPFSGEPLSGLQIMGVYESRNLDFDQVFILSMNEGEFPKKSISGLRRSIKIRI